MRRLPALAIRAALAAATLISCFGWSGARPAPAAAASGGAKFGIVADVGTRYTVYGQQGKGVDLLAGTNVKWAKEEFLWGWVQPSRTEWTWAFMDAAINGERARGIEILGLLNGTPGWAVGRGGMTVNALPPLDLWSNYVAQTVGRYKDRVHAWEVWNEPNVAVFWTGSAQDYAQLLRVTYDTIKRVDPSATVVGPSISGVDEEWLDAMPWDKFDVLGMHMYVPPASLNDQEYSYYNQGLPNFKRVVDRHGGKPIWITEYGFSSGNGGDPWFVGNEGLQSRYLVQEAAETLAFQGLDIQRIMPYVFNDHDGFEMVRGWSSPKPAYTTYRVLNERLGGAAGRGRLAAGAGVFAFRFERDGKQIDVVWAPNGGTAVIPSGGDAEIYDLGGGRRTAGRDGGAVRIGVGADPIYVIHAPPGAPGGGTGAGGSRLFAQTGHSVSGAFLTYWETRGALAIYGYPLSDPTTEVLEDGKPYTVQYFERARFEWHPENPAPYDVLLGQFGRRLHPLYPAVPDCRCGRFFPETGHNIAGGFQGYWEAHGGLAQFGFPITDQVQEQLEDGRTYTVQWFERARFEYHPENGDPQYQILLGQFGRRVHDEQGR